MSDARSCPQLPNHQQVGNFENFRNQGAKTAVEKNNTTSPWRWMTPYRLSQLKIAAAQCQITPTNLKYAGKKVGPYLIQPPRGQHLQVEASLQSYDGDFIPAIVHIDEELLNETTGNLVIDVHWNSCREVIRTYDNLRSRSDDPVILNDLLPARFKMYKSVFGCITVPDVRFEEFDSMIKDFATKNIGSGISKRTAASMINETPFGKTPRISKIICFGFATMFQQDDSLDRRACLKYLVVRYMMLYLEHLQRVYDHRENDIKVIFQRHRRYNCLADEIMLARYFLTKNNTLNTYFAEDIDAFLEIDDSTLVIIDQPDFPCRQTLLSLIQPALPEPGHKKELARNAPKVIMCTTIYGRPPGQEGYLGSPGDEVEIQEHDFLESYFKACTISPYFFEHSSMYERREKLIES